MRQRDPRTIAVFGGTIVLIALAFALLSQTAIDLNAATRPQASIEQANVAKPPTADDQFDAPLRKAGADGTAQQPPAGDKGSNDPADDEREEGLDKAAVLSLAAHAADDYRKRAQYPKWSQPLEEGEDPILRDRTVSPVTARGQDGHTTLTVFPDRVAFESPDRVLLYAFLTIHGERVAAKDMRGQILTESLQPIADLIYSDEGASPDTAAGDHVYSTVFEPPSNRTPPLSESFMVRVFAITPEDDEIVGVTGFQYSNPDAQLTGAYRDRLEDGGLAVEAEVEVRNPGRFHIEASLYDRNGQQPVAWAQQAGDLAPGRHWMPLRYFGRVLHERGIDGPYVLRFVALSTVTQMPNAKNRLVENAYVTAPYDAAQFSNAPFNDPDLLDAARRVEQDLQAGSLEKSG